MRIPKIQVLHVAASVAQRGRVWAGGLREGVTRREIMRGVNAHIANNQSATGGGGSSNWSLIYPYQGVNTHKV